PPIDRDGWERSLETYFPDAGSADQRAAARTACERGTSVVTGGPGTGKTTTIARLLGVLLTLEDEPLRVALAAPTGKAAARLSQAIGEATSRPDYPASTQDEVLRRDRIRALEATTLHRLLGWRPDSSTRFRHDRSNPLPFDVVVVDETSMVSLSMTARLLEAMRPPARLVLVGDADQLASVEAGAVLGDIVRGWSTGGSVRELTTTHRFGRNIRELAEAVRTGDADLVLGILSEGRQEHEPGDGTVLRASAGVELDERLRTQAVAMHQAAGRGDTASALSAFEGHRLLCAHRRGPAGVSHWNVHAERLLMEATHQEWLDEWYPGRPFIVNTNDRGLRLWNGDTGVTCVLPGVEPAAPGRLAGVVGDRSVAARELPTTRLADVSTAYAMTVHRSQGSQFDEVTVLLPDEGSRILTRELLYTAVTRARSTVRVVGSDEAIRVAVTRRAQRATGLAGRLA
ncbi:MAG: exodeoxyribonuclease alpha subunit, partial [Nocardioidaceae bacterium]|nr:exodeoxyribonuclease alpha subunit [Nocardioidaceae bacterium]